jgi:hypothetical protein
MKRTAVLLAWVFLASFCLSKPVLAGCAIGEVVSVEEGKVTLQLEKDKGSDFPVGTRDVEIRKDGKVVVYGRVMAVNGDRITLAVIRGKSSDLSAGVSVEVEQSKTEEKMEGC